MNRGINRMRSQQQREQRMRSKVDSWLNGLRITRPAYSWKTARARHLWYVRRATAAGVPA